MAEIRFDHVSCVYAGAARPAVDELDLTVEDGEFLVIVGPSGCGKTTSLRMLAGLEQVSSGAIFMGERDVTRLSPRQRDIAMVFQSYALYPTMSVQQNIEFPLKVAGVPRRERAARAREVAEMLDLTEYLSRKPAKLSGGQRQRVAMGRAIVRRPQAFLLDEPLSNLDAKLRVMTRTQIAALQRRLGVTTVYVTHDQVEAMTMGDRVAVMRDGVLQQCASPRDIYLRPCNTFVAGFIGSPPMNLLPVPTAERGVRLGAAVVPLPRGTLAALNGDREVILGLRPDAFELTSEAQDAVEVHVSLVEILGSEAYVYGQAAIDGRATDIVLRADPVDAPEHGAVVHARPLPERSHVFSASTGQRLGS
ncbi:MAG TPA: sn-glycerol-3-phosphate ABC transporter ATP-binding protein UgpC [Solirubrobacteraceae bacterium]|nr:sn-glycerol-3-phosphate ABC transporter ATP-binding protein UgpC [Solirubrobacteraceae bacterium]